MTPENKLATATLTEALRRAGTSFKHVSCEFRDHQRVLSVLVEFADSPNFEEELQLRSAGVFDVGEALACAMRAQNIKSPWATAAAR